MADPVPPFPAPPVPGAPAPPLRGQLVRGGEIAPFDLEQARSHQVIYFYPKDSTPGCTTEAHAFDSLLPTFAELGVGVVGVSRDSCASHGRFQAKEGLTLGLLSDPDGEACAAWGVWAEKKNYGKVYMGIVRSTFLVDAAGTVVRAWTNVRVKGHAEDVLEAARGLQPAPR